MILALGAGAALLIAVLFGLRSLGFNLISRVVTAIVLLPFIFIRPNFLSPFQMEDWWLWGAGCVIALLPATFLGNRWLSPPRLWSVLDICSLGALVASFMDLFYWSFFTGLRGSPSEILVDFGLIGYAAIGAFALSEFGQSLVLQRPAGLVTGEIMVTLGALCGAISYFARDNSTSGAIGLGTALAGGVLIAVRVRQFLGQKEEHRILLQQAEKGDQLQPEYTGPSEECPNPSRWSMYDPMTAEVEVLDLIKSIVRALKPELVVETGTFTGISSLSIAEGLRENGFGRLITCEFDREVYERAVARFRASALHSYIDCRCCSSLDLKIDQPIDLLFCDSELTIREAEVRHFIPQVNPYGLILMHDAGSHFKVVREAAFRMESEGLISVVTVSTPRGLVIAQKREGRR
jgi:predicted O-methyltransferase YrrM